MTVNSFEVDAGLQAFIAGFGSRTVRTATYNRSFTTIDDTATLPTNPDAVRISLIYDKIGSGEYDVWIKNVDGTSDTEVTTPR